MNDARRHAQVLCGAHGVPFAGDYAEQIAQGQSFRLVMHLQRANARSEVDHPPQLLGLQRLHQRMATETQHQIQLRRADLQQQVGIARQARDQAFIGFADIEHDGAL